MLRARLSLITNHFLRTKPLLASLAGFRGGRPSGKPHFTSISVNRKKEYAGRLIRATVLTL